ncbi:hypothetical protein Tco_0464539 [Tanacetum coccineum]
MTTLAEFMILSGGDNRPPMLEKHMYDSWKSRMELYIQNKEHGRMILESVEHGPLIWPTIEENGVTRTKIHQTSSIRQIAYNSPQPSTQPLTEFPQMDSDLAVPVFNQGDDPISYLNKVMDFLTAVTSLRFPSTNNQLRTSSNPRNQATIQDGKVTVQQVQGRQGQSYAGNSYKGNATSSRGNNTGGRARVDLDAYDSDCDYVSNVKAVLMANLSSYGSDVLSKVPHSETSHNDMGNQSVHAMHDFE